MWNMRLFLVEATVRDATCTIRIDETPERQFIETAKADSLGAAQFL
jgi:acyl carrier protein